MMKKVVQIAALAHWLSASLLFAAVQVKEVGKPYALQCDALNNPLGDDNVHPLLSWKLEDHRIGAKQSAYRILVASKEEGLRSGKADIWDSGRVISAQSVDVPYAGPALQAETRYFWRVESWDREGKPYPVSQSTWWETGLMQPANWSAQWIGFEDREQRAVRAAAAEWVTNPKTKDPEFKGESHHELRLSFDVPAKIRHATLYVTGSDTPAAWINGTQVMRTQPRPGWDRLPWRSYRRQDATASLREGHNILAVEVTQFSGGDSQTPMNATLYIEKADGSEQVERTGSSGWKSHFQAAAGWQAVDFDDRKWQEPIPFPLPKDAFGNPDRLGDPLPTAAVPSLRQGFTVKKALVSARLYATALGAYKISINGKSVGDQFLSPGWTDFRQRVFYQAYDVTSLLQRGSNVIGALLAPGWYSTPLEWVGQANNYGDTPAALRAQLLLTYSDGSTQWVKTDDSWKADVSPILSAEIYDGEVYDARRQQQRWNQPGFTADGWKQVQIVTPHEPEILWQSFQPIRAHEVLHPVSVKSPKPGVYIYDFGQNFAGIPHIILHGHKNESAQLRFGELLKPDGTLYVENLRNAKATDTYTFASTGAALYEPTFTFHGFRYMQLTGATASLPEVKALALYTDAPMDTRLATGSAMVNKLWHNILWGQRSNFVGTPTDCPQRDERLGWSADAQVFWRTASYNMDLNAFSRKYAGDLRGTLGDVGMFGIYAPGTAKVNNGFGPGWSDAGIVVPWTSWLQTGDTTVIRENWDGMARYLATIGNANPDYLWSEHTGINFGDWLAPEGPTSDTLIATAYWAYDASLMAQMAHAIGNSAEEQKYTQLHDKIRSAFQKKFVHGDGIVSWESTDGKHKDAQESQTGYALALHMNLLPEQMRPEAAERLVHRIEANNWLIGTGFLGTPYLLEDLSDTGHSDAAYRLLLNTNFPSWGYMVEHGATTMWERWNGDKMLGDPGMNSFNHYAYGAVAEWIYRYAAGVDTSAIEPGFRKLAFHPHFNASLHDLDFDYQTRYGSVRSKWSSTDTGFSWTVTIPPNTTADVNLDAAARQIRELRHGVYETSAAQCEKNTACTYKLEPGTYAFEVDAAVGR